ncbi:carbohydrate-binding domain-containing protein [Bacillus sp. T3]|uniref:carbohydrate-binding domain-containing protein n=1 Tax=Bacillus sp. T3 TaxID=467262 RepID=UPI002981B50F|nr:carbohydrate-binding domain-containing protein [Bacillus sp. T3]
MNKKTSFYKAAATSLVCTAFLFGCSNSDSDSESSTTSLVAKAENVKAMTADDINDSISKLVKYDEDDAYIAWKNENPTYIELNGTEANFDTSAAVIFQNNILTIKAGGTYVLSGSLADGQIVVDAEDKNTVRLVLNGVEINNNDSAAIFVSKAEKTVISLEGGTENLLSDGGNYVFDDSSTDEPNATLFSKDNLTINGEGKLVVDANYNNGITSKDELKITGGVIQIDAKDDGLMGRDIVAVKEGTITVHAGGDGVKSSNDKDTSKGAIVLQGGTIDITAVNDGVQAESSLWITDGAYTIATGGGSPETIKTNDDRMGMGGKNGGMSNGTNTTTSTTTTDTTESDSAKGLKATVDIVIGGGQFNLDTSDDAIHSNKNVNIVEGELKIASGDDGVHADTSVITSGGTINVTKSYEGIEGNSITIFDGEINVTTSDDGINVGGGADGSGMDIQATTEGNLLSINGGNIVVNANGDGLDANGSILMTAGTVFVNGPTSSGNGSLDYDSSFEMNGGLLIAAGSSGMAQASSEQSSQNSILMTYPETQEAGTVVHLEDSEGNNIVTFKPAKDYQSVFISSDKIKKDESYTLFSGGTVTGSESNGIYKDGTTEKGGTKVVEFTVSDSVTWLNESGVTTGNSAGGGPGGMGGGAPDGGGGNPGDRFADLDEETRIKVEAIMEQERAGTITREEAQTQLAELGVEFGGPRQ